MARKLRIHFSGAVSHVMLRGSGGRNIFFSTGRLGPGCISCGRKEWKGTAILIDADNYLLQLVRDIHNNPVRAEITE